MTSADGTPGSAADNEVVARLRSAALWAESYAWRLEVADVTSGAALGPPAHDRTARSRTEGRAPVRLKPRVAWAVLVAAAIVAAVVVPQISSDSHLTGGAGTARTTLNRSDKGGGTKPNVAAACTTTVHGVTVDSKGAVVELPINPGPIISPARAIGIARSEVRTGGVLSASAKLSSWTEVAALIDASTGHRDAAESTPGPAAEPWSPVWAVVMETVTSFGGSWTLVVMEAATGGATLLEQTPALPGWFPSLSDRDPTLKGCPGGSSARLPFGVLTRDEEAYVVHAEQGSGTEAILTLTSVPALNRADPGLYGGCVRQNCSLDELVWPLFLVYKAAPGHTIACAPWSYPPGYRPRQVKEYFTLSVTGNSEMGCGPVPAALANLKDLAPPAG
jgi:hypothetical protein